MQVSRIYLIGFMGAGKTTVGRVLAKKLGLKFIDLDKEIERRESRRIADIFRVDGEATFRVLERKYLQELALTEHSVIALGGGTFVDPENRSVAEKTGLTVWLKVSFAKVAARVKIDGTRPKFGNRDEAARLFKSRESSYALAKIHVSADKGSPESVAKEIIGALQNT